MEFLSEKSSCWDILNHPDLAREMSVITALHTFIPTRLGPQFGQQFGNMCVLESFLRRLPIKTIIYGLNGILEAKRQGRFGLYRLWGEDKSGGKQDVWLFRFSCGKKAPYAVICPGGAYVTVAAMAEGFPVARELNEKGFNAFVLLYRTGGHASYPAPLDDLAQAIRFIRLHHDAFQVEKDAYSVFGFSAGGHMAGCFGTKDMGYAHYELPRPQMLAMGYPVVTMELDQTHRRSRKTLLGRHPQEKMVTMTSVDKQITPEYPPVYLWHSTVDASVPVENSRMLHHSLSRYGIEHIFREAPDGSHGIGPGYGTSAEGWLDQAAYFWRRCVRETRKQ